MGCNISYVTVMDAGRAIVSVECPVSYCTLCFLSGAESLVDMTGKPFEATTRFRKNCQVVRRVKSQYAGGEVCSFCQSEFPDEDFRFHHMFWCCATQSALKTN
jgi:hypothetical protein